MRIVSITGVSGAGKTTLQDSLVEMLGYTRVVSNTTRKERRTDRIGEYRYFTCEELASLDGVLWSVEVHGNHYATCAKDLITAARIGAGAVVIITIDCIERLQTFCAVNSTPCDVFHLLAPEEAGVLKNRLLTRGDTVEDVERRIADCTDWDSVVRTYKDVHFVPPLDKSGVLECVIELLK